MLTFERMGCNQMDDKHTDHYTFTKLINKPAAVEAFVSLSTFPGGTSYGSSISASSE